MSRTIDVRNPRSGKTDYQIEVPDLPQMQQEAARLRAGQATWADIGLEGRKAAMLEMCEAVDRHYDAILDALCADTGRYEMSVAEIEGLKGITRMRVATADAALQAVTGASGDASLTFRQQYVPYQLVGIISPWNYPLILSMIDAITALLAGSAVLAKPSEVTPRFVKPFLAAIAEVPHLRDVLGYCEGDGETGGQVIDLTDMVVFTGSVPTGRKVQERAAGQFKTAFLELGGNDPAVVLDSADAAVAAEIIVRGAMENSGQLCCSIERVYAGPEIFEPLLQEVTERTAAMTLNTEGLQSGELGPIIFARQAEVLQAQLDDAVAKGARIVTGGNIVEKDGGLWCEPTVLVDVTQDMAIMQEETFGPIIPIARFSDPAEAVRLANDTGFGLSATVIGAEQAATEIGEQINAGGVWINDFDTMGGVGDQAEKTAFGVSGLGGTRYGPGGFFRFLRKKALVVRKPASA
ncbi:aldehyde dehydrogenase family protein [Pseudodonghicola flavimaris]|uniref:Aldehyde dehydrogenase family protein n=1 Tax=Pseudodonghicola flavimaris TaxID=3050036 RepID=A0ABT7F2D4_9RHOB|nr:aldehyde dehydrogenase family protein [Pseudodonghicola flavimaris]MDK3018763.1 aldehyde dehydrogenase family protein [Pseudodonghicola flavimaris]